MNRFFDLSSHITLRVLGVDRERFLNGQLTNDVRKATRTNAIEACVLNAKGKLNGHLFLTCDENAFLIDADPAQRDSLQPRLERYIIADDVRIENVTGRYALFHLLSKSAPDFSSEVRSANRFGEPGFDLWTAAERHAPIIRELSEQFQFCDADCAEVFRIERGIPRWGRELTDEIIPVEANLEARVIDYEKGCYIGQEVISRMKMSGQTNKRLRGVVGAGAEAGMKMIAAGGKEAGWVTSTAESERLGQRIGLGFVKRGFNSPGTKLDGISPANPDKVAPLQIVDLPFVGVGAIPS